MNDDVPLRREKRLLSVDDAAEYLGLSPWTVRAMGADGTLPVVRLGRRVLFDKADLDRLIQGAKVRETIG